MYDYNIQIYYTINIQYGMAPLYTIDNCVYISYARLDL